MTDSTPETTQTEAVSKSAKPPGPHARELYAPANPRQRRTWTAMALVLAIVFMFAGDIIAVVPAIIGGFLTPEQLQLEPAPLNILLFILIATFAVTAIITLAWSWLFERRRPAVNGLNENGLVRFVRGFAIGGAFLLTVIGVISALGGYAIEGPGAFATPAAFTGIGLLLFGFIVQSSTEEIVFRGWLMSLISSRHGLVLAVAINSILFGAVHGLNLEPSRELFLGVANVVLFGVFISLYAAKEGSIWGVCGWHAAWNWLLGVGFGIEVSGQVVDVAPLAVDLASKDTAPWWITGAAFGPEASVVTTAVLLAGAAFLIWRGGFARR